MIRTAAVVLAATAAVAVADFANFDAETEGFKGTSFTTDGITIFSVNNNSGLNPDGSTFNPGDYGSEVIIERALVVFNDFPSVVSAPNMLSFGGSLVPGDNTSVNLLTEVFMTNNQTATEASLDLVHFENGPWGGIIIRLDALDRGAVVASDTHTISDLGGRDNPRATHLAVSGVAFDTIRLHAVYPDGTSTVIAGLVDNVSITPAPASALAFAGLGLVGVRRRR